MADESEQKGTQDSADRAIGALRDLNLAAAAFRHVVAARYRVSVTDTHAISYLAAYGPLGQTELAQRLSLSTSAVTSLLDRLEAAGAVQRRPHPSDRRRIEVRVARRGLEAVAEIRAALRGALETVEEDELMAAAQTLTRFCDAMRDATRALEAMPAETTSVRDDPPD